MTSEQWFETVDNSFTALSLVDLVDPDSGNGLLILHKGNQQWFRFEDHVECVLVTNDPWDGDRMTYEFDVDFQLVPHGPLSNADRWKLAQEFRQFPVGQEFGTAVTGDLPLSFSLASCKPDNVVMTALYRETIDSGQGTEGYAADWEYPYVLRLVEFDGIASTATITFNATVARAVKTDLMGANGVALKITESQIEVPMRPYEIATIYLDLVEGRKQTRDLDAKRKIWATVHRV